MVWTNLGGPQYSMKLELGQHQALAVYIFRLSLEAVLPRQHRGAEFEGPLVAVFRQRNLEVGSRLKCITPEEVQKGDFGYFLLPEPFQGKVWLRYSKTLLDVLTADQVKQASDWRLSDNSTFEAALVSVTSGFSQGLWPLARKALGADVVKEQCPAHDDSFEHPGAGDAFPMPKTYETKASPVATAPLVTTTASASAGAAGIALGTGIVLKVPAKPRKQLDMAVVKVL